MSIFLVFTSHAREGMGRGLIVAGIDTFMMKHFGFSSSAMGIVVHFMNRAQMHFQNNFQIIPDIRPTFGDAPHPPPPLRWPARHLFDYASYEYLLHTYICMFYVHIILSVQIQIASGK